MHDSRKIRFEAFEADLNASELRKNGRKLKISGQPFQVLAILLERPGELVTREELQKRIWPDTFVDVDHNLNTAINKVREVLGDSPTNPRLVETLPRRGYRFIGALNNGGPVKEEPQAAKVPPPKKPFASWAYLAIALAAVVAIAGAYLLVRRNQHSVLVNERILTRITFDKGLQVGATWSPDGHFLAYASNRGGKFDIWLQQVSGGNPVQLTHRSGNNWQPDWSPDGKFLVYRSEEGDGGLFVVPAVGGDGQERKISSFGYDPQWSPDGSQILFLATHFTPDNDLYVVGLDAGQPQPILSDFFARHRLGYVAAAAWHPDGKRISLSIWNVTPVPEFWTVTIGSAEGVRTELDQAITAQLVSAPADLSVAAELTEFKFRWAPSGNAIYFERTLRGARNLWKMTIDRATLRGTRIDRLTTGAGADTELALSRDGTKLAFTSKAVHVAAWMFPFNASSGQLTGAGSAISAPGSATRTHAMSNDGSKIAILTERSGRVELWEKSLLHNDEVPVLIDDHAPRGSSWSPDGKRLAYYCEKSAPGENEIDLWSSDTRTQQRLMPPNTNGKMPHDWTPDGRELLIVEETRNSRSEIWSVPTSPAPDTLPRKVATDPRYDLYQPHFSPDGHWIVLEAVTVPFSESVLYVIPVKGGRWIPLPAIGHWDDKPRFSPDGKVIYYLSERHGFFNVWGIRFDKDRGVLTGKPFRVTNFESPDLMVPTFISPVELSIAKDKFVVNLAEVSGSIWMLEKVQ